MPGARVPNARECARFKRMVARQVIGVAPQVFLPHPGRDMPRKPAEDRKRAITVGNAATALHI